MKRTILEKMASRDHTYKRQRTRYEHASNAAQLSQPFNIAYKRSDFHTYYTLRDTSAFASALGIVFSGERFSIVGTLPNRQRTILIKNQICYRLGKSPFRFRATFYALSLQDDYFKSTIAITLKLADHVLTLLLSRMVPKRGQLTVPEAAAALFQYHPPNQTAIINRLYVYRPNSSSHEPNSLYFSIHLV